MQYLFQAIDLLFQVYILIIVVRALISWVPHNPFNPVVAFVATVTEPVLGPIRRGLPPNSLGIDASPIVAIILLWALWKIVIYVLSLI